MHTLRHILLPAVLLLLPLSISAQKRARGGNDEAKRRPPMELFQKVEIATSPVNTLLGEAFAANPATMVHFSNFTLSRFSVEALDTRSTEAQVVQEGTGKTFSNINASSYMRLSNKAVVWGQAQFSLGKRRDILWNNAGDYSLVGPYVLGDSVGGNLSCRLYRFSGGYSGKARGWNWGAEMGYTASIDYRNRDPRDKIVVSDLHLRAGVARCLSSTYAVGAAASMRVYNQESDIDFYNPNNEIRTYALTGLGHYYPRFSGNGQANTAYTGLGLGAVLNLVPLRDAGVFATADFRHIRIKQILRDYNNLGLTEAPNYFGTLRTGYIFRPSETLKFSPTLTVDTRRQLGYENIFGSAVGNTHSLIGSRRNYRHDILTASLSLPMELSAPGSSTRIDLIPSLAATRNYEEYRLPRRSLAATLFTPSLQARAAFRANRLTRLEFGLFGSRTWASDAQSRLPGINLASGMGTSVLHNFAMLTAPRTTVGASATAYRLLSPSMALKLSLAASATSFDHHGTASRLSLTAALVF